MSLGERLLKELETNLPEVILKGGKILLLVLLFWLVSLIGKALIRKITQPLERKEDPSTAARVKTIRSLLNSLFSLVLLFILILMVLDIFGIKTTPILGAAGVLGVAVGLGTQTFVRDAFYGFLIVMEDQFRVGDMVTVAGITGTVEAMTYRTTRIRGEDGKLYIISNSSITQVCNHSRGGFYISSEIALSNEEKRDRIEEAVKEAGERLKNILGEDLLSLPQIENISSFDSAKTTYRFSLVANPSRKKEAERLFKEILREVFLQKELKLV
ncbi:MAG: mechanosensitive ion channel family protein [bacterium]